MSKSVILESCAAHPSEPGCTFEILSPLDEPGWDSVANFQGEAAAFHGASWAKVLQRTYDHYPVYCVVRDRGQLRAVLPLMEVSSPLTGKRAVSLPFTDECQPLGFTPPEYQRLLHLLVERGKARQWKYLECRGGKDLIGEVSPWSRFYGHTLELKSGESDLFARMDGSVRRAIRKAKGNGVTVTIANTLEAVREYYGLHCQTRRWHGLPPQPWTFFSNIHAEILSKERGFASLAMWGGKAVAGAIFFVSGRKALYKFGASTRRLLPLRGNHLAMWEAIRWLLANGSTCLEFGRTSIPNLGLRRFKLSWGTSERVVDYFRYDFRTRQFASGSGSSGEWHWPILRWMPLPLLRWAGALAYRHLS